MRYQGGKSRIARQIRQAIFDHGGTARFLWEPFCGGCGATPQLLQLASNVICSDTQVDLIKMWQAVQLGWTPPSTVTEKIYREAKQLPVTDPLRAFIRFGCSFGGKSWGGYARGLTNNVFYDYAAQSCRSIERFRSSITCHGKVIFVTFNFVYKMRRGLTRDTIIYCDPPYASTAGYGTDFDHVAFWQRCEQYARRGMRVYVSEYVAPGNWICLWERRQTNINGLRRDSMRPTEKLFTYRG